jgi:hypothetical protein
VAQLTFATLPTNLPIEILCCILQHWTAAQRFTIAEVDCDSIVVTYACTTDAATASLPPDLHAEYWRLRHLSWLTTPKYFSDPHDFQTIRAILSDAPNSSLLPFTAAYYPMQADIHSLITTPYLTLPFHGLEHPILDFSAPQYFSFFDVCVPPFDDIDVHDRYLHRAERFLQHCRNFTLVFGATYRYSHLWYSLDDVEGWDHAKFTPKASDIGFVVDWILEFAWAHGWVEHLRSVKLERVIQDWERRWECVFARYNEGRERGEELQKVYEGDVRRTMGWRKRICRRCESAWLDVGRSGGGRRVRRRGRMGRS